MNNKSRPERPYRCSEDENDRETRKKVKKRNVSKPKSCKYVPGEYILDTKGRIAEIKYIGECHKGPGTWFGIEFVDGSLGKHNGSYPSLGKTYFQGADDRCTMIRGDKIRSKANMKCVPEKKYIAAKPSAAVLRSNFAHAGRHIRTRTVSDLMDLGNDSYSAMSSVSMEELSLDFSANYYKKKSFNDRNRGKTTRASASKSKAAKHHARTLSQPSNINESRSLNSVFCERTMTETKSREERLLAIGDADFDAAYLRKYKTKTPPIRTAKKEKYTGNKYILAMSKENEKKRHQRIDGIKKAKKRITKQKHERKSSQLQEILKEKELRKEELLKRNEEHRLRELQRIQMAKQKSRHRLTQSMDARTQLSNISVIFNEDDSDRDDIDILDEEDEDEEESEQESGQGSDSADKTPVLQTSATPLAEFTAELSPGLTPIPSDFPSFASIPSIPVVSAAKSSSPEDGVDQVLPFTSLSVRSYSDSDFRAASNFGKYAMEPMVTVKTDSALILQELAELRDATSTDVDCVVDASKSRSSSPIHVPSKVRDKERTENASILHFSDLCLKDSLMERSLLRKKEVRHNKNDGDDDSKSEAEDTFYFPVSNHKKPTHSLPSMSTLARVNSAPVVTTDDKGTDYWIKQYNKANKRQKKKSKKPKKSNKRSQTKSQPQPQAQPQQVREAEVAQSSSTVLRRSPPITLPKPSKPIALKISARNGTISSKNSWSTSSGASTLSAFSVGSPNDMFDVQSTLSAFSAYSNVSAASTNDRYELESLTINSGFSSLMSSPVTSATSTPETDNKNGAHSNYSVVSADIKMQTHHDVTSTSAMASRAPKYGTYPLQQNREQYIKQRFTGIVRIGHRYVLRDGRIGVIRFNGCTRFAPGTWVGFELDDDEGESDGSVYDVRYFQCGAKYGTFVTKAQIAQYVGRDTTKSLSRAQLQSMSAIQM